MLTMVDYTATISSYDSRLSSLNQELSTTGLGDKRRGIKREIEAITNARAKAIEARDSNGMVDERTKLQALTPGIRESGVQQILAPDKQREKKRREDELKERGFSQEEIKGMSPQEQFRTLNPKTAQKQYQTPQGDFSGVDGQNYDVQYSENGLFLQRPLSTGITKAIQAKQGFGNAFGSSTIGFSTETIKKNPLDYRPQYSSDYGFSTNTGRAEIFYEKDNDISEPIQPSSKNIVNDLKSSWGSYLGRQDSGISPPTAQEQNKMLGAPVRFMNLGAYKLGSYLERKGLEKNTPNIYIGRYIKEQSLGGYSDPGKQLSYTAVSLGAGAGTGKVIGSGMKWLAAKETIKFGRPIVAGATQKVLLPIGGAMAVGTTAYEVGTSSGLTPSYSFATLAGSGYGFAKGYGSIIRPTSIEVNAYGSVRPKGLSITESGKEVSIIASRRAKVTVNDLGNQYNYNRDIKINARTVSGNFQQFGDTPYVLRTRTTVPLRGRSTLIQSEYASSYVPATEGNVGIFTGVDRRTGAGFETIVSPRIDANIVSMKGFDTEINAVRTTTFQGERLTSVFEGVSRRDSVRANLVKIYNNKELGVPIDTMRVSGVTKGKTTRTDIVVTDIESFRGLRLLKERNLIVESEGYKTRKFFEKTKNNLNDGFFNTKKVYSTVVPVFEKPITEPVSIRKPITEGLPRERFKIPEIAGVGSMARTYQLRTPFLGGTISRQRASSQYKNNIVSEQNTIPISRTTPEVQFYPVSKTITSTDKKIASITSYDTAFSSTTAPSNYGFTTTSGLTPKTTTPPFMPLVPLGAPLWGKFGTPEANIVGGKQSYRYAPSFSAGILNIRGSAPSTLTGLETRPLVSKKRGRRR